MTTPTPPVASPAIKTTFDPATGRWEGIPEQTYKFSLGDQRGMGWRNVSRFTFGTPPALPAEFELRYFELGLGGYSSIEKHTHVHMIMVLRGKGKALVGHQVLDVAPFDLVYVPPETPHRWVAEGDEPFGFLCPVDAGRDHPKPLDPEEWEALRANPETEPYVF